MHILHGGTPGDYSSALQQKMELAVASASRMDVNEAVCRGLHLN